MARLVADEHSDVEVFRGEAGGEAIKPVLYERSRLYEDWAIQGVPTYIVVDRDGVVRGRSHEVESLYDVILEATGADGETRAKLVGEFDEQSVAVYELVEEGR